MVKDGSTRIFQNRWGIQFIGYVTKADGAAAFYIINEYALWIPNEITKLPVAKFTLYDDSEDGRSSSLYNAAVCEHYYDNDGNSSILAKQNASTTTHINEGSFIEMLYIQYFF